MIYAIIATIGVAAIAIFIGVVIYKAMLDMLYYYVLERPLPPMRGPQRAIMIVFAMVVGIGMGTMLYVLGLGFAVPIYRFFLQMVG